MQLSRQIAEQYLPKVVLCSTSCLRRFHYIHGGKEHTVITREAETTISQGSLARLLLPQMSMYELILAI